MSLVLGRRRRKADAVWHRGFVACVRAEQTNERVVGPELGVFLTQNFWLLQRTWLLQ